MKNKGLYILWSGLFILCAACGFIPSPEGAVRPVLTALSVMFFLPPAWLLHRARQQGDTDTIKLVRNLSGASLLLTGLVLVLSFLLALRGRWLGEVLHALLIVISCPMVCSGYWVLSLFLWACLLMVSLSMLRKK